MFDWKPAMKILRSLYDRNMKPSERGNVSQITRIAKKRREQCRLKIDKG